MRTLCNTTSAAIAVCATALALSAPSQAGSLNNKIQETHKGAVQHPYGHGLFIGGHAGYGWADMSGFYNNDEIFNPTDLGALEPESTLGGVQGGFNFQAGRLVAGVEADFSWGELDDSILSTEPPTIVPDTLSAEIDNLGSVRGRLGAAFDTNGRFLQSVLLYGTAGLAYADLEFHAENALNETICDISLDDTAPVYGGGVEVGLGRRVSVRAEYLHYDFDRQFNFDELSCNTSEDDEPTGQIVFESLGVVRVGLNMKLGAPFHRDRRPTPMK